MGDNNSFTDQFDMSQPRSLPLGHGELWNMQLVSLYNFVDWLRHLYGTARQCWPIGQFELVPIQLILVMRKNLVIGFCLFYTGHHTGMTLPELTETHRTDLCGSYVVATADFRKFFQIFSWHFTDERADFL